MEIWSLESFLALFRLIPFSYNYFITTYFQNCTLFFTANVNCNFWIKKMHVGIIIIHQLFFNTYYSRTCSRILNVTILCKQLVLLCCLVAIKHIMKNIVSSSCFSNYRLYQRGSIICLVSKNHNEQLCSRNSHR